MNRIDQYCLEQVTAALEQYRQAVEKSNLAPATKRTYLQHAESFVRWLDGGFEPGGGQQPKDIYS